MSMLAPRGVTQACGLPGIGMGPESAWQDKSGGGEKRAHRYQRPSHVHQCVTHRTRHLLGGEEFRVSGWWGRRPCPHM